MKCKVFRFANHEVNDAEEEINKFLIEEQIKRSEIVKICQSETSFATDFQADIHSGVRLTISIWYYR